ncbi:MAG: hypothetical protein FJ387_16315 [Verrucomicrobia bacterium]|nr:hypothetical protein [Verrucomicrobiota bacterium]
MTAAIFTPPSLFPRLLPWLAVLLLLLLKPNRSPQAWWVWLPLLGVYALNWVAQGLLEFLPSQAFEVFSQIFSALAFGVTGLWLGAPYLGRSSRVAAFFLVLGGLGILSGVVFALQGDWSGDGALETSGMLLFMGVCVLLLSLALTLAALTCRRRYGPLRFSLWLLGYLVGGWLVVGTPFFLVALLSGGAPVGEFLAAVLSFATVTFLVVLPFLILWFVNPFYRTRLQALWQLAAGAPPAGAPA